MILKTQEIVLTSMKTGNTSSMQMVIRIIITEIREEPLNKEKILILPTSTTTHVLPIPKNLNENNLYDGTAEPQAEEELQQIRNIFLKKPEVEPKIESSTNDDQPPQPPSLPRTNRSNNQANIRLKKDDNEEEEVIDTSKPGGPGGAKKNKNSKNSKNNNNQKYNKISNKDGNERANGGSNNDKKDGDGGSGASTVATQPNAKLSMDATPFVPPTQKKYDPVAVFQPLKIQNKNTDEINNDQNELYNEISKYVEDLARSMAIGLQATQEEVRKRQDAFEDAVKMAAQELADLQGRKQLELIESSVKEFNLKNEDYKISLNKDALALVNEI